MYKCAFYAPKKSLHPHLSSLRLPSFPSLFCFFFFCSIFLFQTVYSSSCTLPGKCYLRSLRRFLVVFYFLDNIVQNWDWDWDLGVTFCFVIVAYTYNKSDPLYFISISYYKLLFMGTCFLLIRVLMGVIILRENELKS